MPSDNHHDEKLGQLYGHAVFVAKSRDTPDHQLVCFQTPSHMHQAMMDFEYYHQHKFPDDAIEIIGPFMAVWMPTYARRKHGGLPGITPEEIRTYESRFLEDPANKVPLIEAKNIVKLSEKISSFFKNKFAEKSDAPPKQSISLEENAKPHALSVIYRDVLLTASCEELNRQGEMLVFFKTEKEVDRAIEQFQKSIPIEKFQKSIPIELKKTDPTDFNGLHGFFLPIDIQVGPNHAPTWEKQYLDKQIALARINAIQTGSYESMVESIEEFAKAEPEIKKNKMFGRTDN